MSGEMNKPKAEQCQPIGQGSTAAAPDAASLRREALRLKSLGFSVVPVRAGTKEPAVRWKPYTTQRASGAQIAAWWPDGHDSPHGLAIVTGAVSQDIVLDFDPKNGHTAADLLAEAEKAFGQPFPETCRVATASGGLHLHYFLPENSDPGLTRKTIFRGNAGEIEVRANDSICLMPPSVARNRAGLLGAYAYHTPLNRRADITATWLWEIITQANSLPTAGGGPQQETAAGQAVSQAEKPPRPTAADVQEVLARWTPRLTREARRILGKTPADAADRSKLCYQFGLEALKSGVADRRELACLITAIPSHRDKYGPRPQGTEWDEWDHAWRLADKLLSAHAENAAAQFEVVTFKELEPTFRPPEFVLYPLLPRREITLLDGDDGSGKTWVCLALAAGLTGSEVCPIPYDNLAPKNVRVLILTAEDDPSVTIGPRLRDLGANLDRISIIRPVGAEYINGVTVQDFAAARPVIVSASPDLVIVDHITVFEMTGDVDSAKAAQVRRVLDPLKELARDTNAAVLVVRHFRKSGGSAKDRGGGSVAYRFTARSHLVLGLDPDDPNKRVLTQVKMNLVPRLRESLVFTLNENSYPPFTWVGTANVDPDALTDPAKAKQVREERSSRAEAEAFLREYLSDGQEVPVTSVLKAARSLGISRRTLYRAAEALGVVSRHFGFGRDKTSTWRLP